MMKQKVLFAAAEAAPFYKTGGLGDVAYALPKYLAQSGVDVRVVVPYYTKLFPKQYKTGLEDVISFQIDIPYRGLVYCGIKKYKLNDVNYYFIDNEEFFGRDNLYGYWDDGERFAFFQLAICRMMEVINFIPDVVHINDWHTAFVPVLLRDKFHWIEKYKGIKTLLTIHNLQFQGIFDPVILDTLFGMGWNSYTDDGAKFYDQINFLKGGINFADAVNTVSPSYAREIQTPEFGEQLDGVLRKNSWKLSGIINGIDSELYNPETDIQIKANYNAADLSGKAIDKSELQAELGLPVENVPLYGVVSRLTTQKGMDLFLDTLDDFLSRHKAQVVVLGTGDPELERRFEYYQNKYPNQLVAQMKFDIGLAQRIYAGSDVFVMPSAFEPSGLSQMMAMRYGTLPLVHAVGGLRDTVIPYNELDKTGTGFTFDDYRSNVLGEILSYSFRTYDERQTDWKALQQQAMERDFDWSNSAQDYLNLYDNLAE
ncbi:glycogen synthase GlgA [Pediococcus claussenii]|uniref:Glycogen synthase n=1 Tax=Pediococcus claussenii (strain ATCC BAA-344 / DSM 14800 / JCM 18046 / KCTC 3811 / LMG 21948 / P06) TaxID=701521 RepID=G8PAM6_PEDCP|nr:glycogen/starch synthase [Pediococcus claussenii ATCC BAA-344]ANZ69796.1 starch synthase [Pediococcus claussenii]ANZ71613.1 starch synthase [Pediococcus claussenii]KRN19709.1 glgA protein [Pediococcus claussenii]